MQLIPVLKPLLPDADRLLPYLRRIDAERIYSNMGPLCREFEQRIGQLIGLPEGCVVSASSGTAALAATILASVGRPKSARPYAAIPAFTFTATASAVQECGYEPLLADVKDTDWLLDPDKLSRSPYIHQVGLVVPVGPFGRPVPQEPWLSFQERHNIPVIIDGAASLEGLIHNPSAGTGPLPVALSFHATKSFATGEGGAVICTQPALLLQVRRALNFGILGVRETTCASINGKMSEYHAAIGLAECDGWSLKVQMCHDVLARYRTLMQAAGLDRRLITAPHVACCYVLFQCKDADEAGRVQRSLNDNLVDWRLWYGGGIHTQAYFSTATREPLPMTDAIAPRLIGLPFAPDLPEPSIRRVVAAIEAAL